MDEEIYRQQCLTLGHETMQRIAIQIRAASLLKENETLKAQVEALTPKPESPSEPA